MNEVAVKEALEKLNEASSNLKERVDQIIFEFESSVCEIQEATDELNSVV